MYICTLLNLLQSLHLMHIFQSPNLLSFEDLRNAIAMYNMEKLLVQTLSSIHSGNKISLQEMEVCQSGRKSPH